MKNHNTAHGSRISADSLAIHADREKNQTRAVAPPIYQTSNFLAESSEEFAEAASQPRNPQFYTRAGNPTHSQAEAVVAALEGGEEALLCASGMGAMTSAVLSQVQAGDHVVGQRSHYPGTTGLLRDFLPRYGVEVTFVDGTQTSEFASAIRPNTKLIVLETPTNPIMEIVDLEAVSKIARPKKITTLVDNTLASPINQRPLELGIDIIIHSATKYLSGHSDLILGAVVSDKKTIETVWKTYLTLGCSLNAFDSWVMLRGLRTLPLRMARHNQNAQALAEFLSDHPRIERVHYSGLKSHPQHALAKKQMSGFGGLLSFEIKGNGNDAEKLISSLTLAVRASSLGGVESIVVRPAVQWEKLAGEEGLKKMGIKSNLIRFSCGLEGTDDLIQDLEQALKKR